MDLQRLQQLLSNMPGRGAPAPDTPAPDTSEKIQISSLSLLKMLKHGLFIVVTLLTHLPSYKMTTQLALLTAANTLVVIN
jgi:hypothetical protein